MKSRISLALLLIMLFVSFSGCPTSPAISTGVWLFTVDNNSVVGLTLGNGGQAQTPNPQPPEANTNFTGTLTWVQNGSTFILTQVADAFSTEYSGTVDTGTSIINGTWMRTVGSTSSGTWFGEKL